MDLQWYLAGLVEGPVLAELPLAGKAVKRALSADDSASWTFGPTDPRTPKVWDSLIEPGGVMVVAVLDGHPLQGWAITDKDTSSGSAPEIAGPTLEGLLSRVFVRDYEAYGLDEAFICAEIAEQVFSPGFNFITTAYASGTTRDVYYDGTSDLTVRQLLEEYAASAPAIDFITDVEWAPGEEGSRFQKRLRIGSDLGTVRPDVILDSKSILSHKRKRSFSEGFGATRTWGVSDGSGDTRPLVGPFESPLINLWGPWESRPSFTTVSDEEGLAQRAEQAAIETATGTEVWEFVLDLDRAPRFGEVWDVGDTLPFEVAPSSNDPRGGRYAGRVLSCEIDAAANTLTPTLAQKDGAV